MVKIPVLEIERNSLESIKIERNPPTKVLIRQPLSRAMPPPGGRLVFSAPGLRLTAPRGFCSIGGNER